MKKTRKKFLRVPAVLAVCVLFLSMLTVTKVQAASYPRLVDDAQLLDNREAENVLAKLDEISNRQQFDIVIVTTDDTNGKSAMAYADDFYDENGYGYGSGKDGVLLLVDMGERDWWISTCGYGITVFTDAGISYISDCFLEDLSAGYYEDAFLTFAEQCDAFVTQARNGRAYDVHNLPKEPFAWGSHLVFALVVGFVIALIVVSIMKGQLKTVRRQNTADSYVRRDSMHLTDSKDIFLYAKRDRTARPQPSESHSGGSSVHVSSSGTSHGGGGGKF